MEGRQLAAELAAIPLPDFAAGPPETEAAVAGLGAATAPAVAAVLAAAERAHQLTGDGRCCADSGMGCHSGSVPQ
jgi:hypothetical protein